MRCVTRLCDRGSEWAGLAEDGNDGLLNSTILITFLIRSFLSLGWRWICLERVEREKTFRKVCFWRDFSFVDGFVGGLFECVLTIASLLSEDCG
jgi:hypothetical protein